MKSYSGLLSFSIVLVLVLIHESQSLCCPWVLTQNAKCECSDGGLVHPWECCSEGSCNIFCCNCGAPCRENQTDPDALQGFAFDFDRFKRAILDAEDGDNGLQADRLTNGLIATAMHFANIDEDGDMRISFEETMKYLSRSRKNFPHRLAFSKDSLWFVNMDKNGDGHLGMDEFDPDLAELALPRSQKWF